jgi:hypothetical protein
MAIDDFLNATPRSTQQTPNPQEDANMFTDVLAAPFRGVEGAVQSLYDLADFATGDDLLPDYDTRFLGRSKTFAGGMVEGVSQFMTGFIPVAGQLSKVGKLSTAAKGLKGARGARKLNLKGNMAAGAVADFSMFQAQEDRLSNLIETFPTLSNPISDYLAADEDDGEIEGRLKNTLEGLALGGVVDGLIAGVKAIKKSRRGDDPKAILEEYENVVFSGDRNEKLLQEDLDSTQTFRASLSKAMGRDVTGESTSAFDLLQGYSQGYDGELAPLFKALLSNAPESLKNTVVNFGEGLSTFKSSVEHATGQATGTITMGNGGVRTLAHELMHATTLHKLNTEVKYKTENPAEFKEMMTEVAARSDNATSGLARTYLKAVEKLGLDEKVFGKDGIAGSNRIHGASHRTADTPYAFTNLAEFISEAFSNEEFRMVLSAMESDVPKKSVFDELLAAVKGMLGLSATDGSLLDDVFKYTGDIVSEQNRMFDEQFSFLKDIDQLHGQAYRTLNTIDDVNPTGNRKSDFTDGFQLLDGDGKVVRDSEVLDEAGIKRPPVSEMQTDYSKRQKYIRKDWTLNFGSKNWRGKKVSEVPSEYLKKALEWDSVKPNIKEKIENELHARRENGEELYDFHKERKTEYTTVQKQEAQEKIKRLQEYQELQTAINHPKKGLKTVLESYKTQLENTPSSDLPNPKNAEDISPDKRQKLEAKIKEVEKNIAVGEKKIANVKKAMGLKEVKKETDETKKATTKRIKELRAENEFILASGKKPKEEPKKKGKTNDEELTSEEVARGDATRARVQQEMEARRPVLNPTLQEAYRNYRRNKAGGLANPRVESFKDYIEARGLDMATPTTQKRLVPDQLRDEGISTNPYNVETAKINEKAFVDNTIIKDGRRPDEDILSDPMSADLSRAQRKEFEKGRLEAKLRGEEDEYIENFKKQPFLNQQGNRKATQIRRDSTKTFGQAEATKAVEEEVASAITRLARQLKTGGDQAIMSAARNISSSRAAVGVISAVAENLKSQGVKGEKVTAEELAAETKEMVDLLGGNQNTWAGAVAKLKQAGGRDLADFRTQQRAAKTLIDLMSRDLVDLAKEASAARKDSSKNLAELEAKVVSGIDQLTEVQRIWSLMGKEAGLSLVQRKFLDGSNGGYRLNKDVGFDFIARDPEDYAKYTNETTGTMDVQDVINKLVMAGSDSDVARAIDGTAAANARMKSVGALTKEMQGGKMMNMVTEYWMNSLLSGPATQVVNTLGSALTTSLRMGEMAFGGLLRGEPDVARAILGYAFKMENIKEAITFAGKAWNTQDAVLTKGSVAFNDTAKRTDAITSQNVSQMMTDRGKKFDVNQHDSIAKAVDTIGTGVRLPSRGLMTVDEFFKQLNYRAYVRTNLAYEGLQAGKANGKELAEFVNERFQNYITKGGRAYNEANVYLDAVETSKTLHGLEYGGDQMSVIQAQLAQNPYDASRGGLADAALEFSKVNTFTNDLAQDSVVGILGDTLGKLKTKIPMLNFVVPFINTPTNILKFALDRTPLGMGADLTYRRKKLTEGLNSDDPFVRAEHAGRLATGVSIVGAGMWYALSNKEFITGGGPRTQEEKEALKLTGWQPYSLKIGAKYFSYQRLDPMATVIGLFADLVEAQEYYDLDDTMMGNMFSAVSLSFSNNVTNKSYVQGLDNMLNMLRDPEANSKALVGNIAGGFVPTLFSQGQNYSDERVLRETRTVFDYMLKKSPASGMLPKKRNFLGEAVKYENLPMGAGIFNPVYISSESDNMLDQELGSLAHGFNKQNSKIGGSLQTKDIYNEEGRQAYDVWLEKTSTTKIGGKTLRQTLAQLVKRKDYQALQADSDSDIGEKSPRIRVINNWLRRFRKQARREMLEEFPDLQGSLDQLTQEKQQYRLIQ